MSVKTSSTPVALFLHSGEYDRVHQGLSIAAAASASGRTAYVFFFWGALARLAEDRLDEPEPSELSTAVVDFEARGVPTLRQLLAHLRESNSGKLYACTGSMVIVGAAAEALESKVDQFVGWTTILKLTEGITDRFYL
jgi:peroxiredoxin family protein